MATEKPVNPVVPPSSIEVEVPKTAEEFAAVLLEGVARALKCALSSKELTEAVKAGESLYKTLYQQDDEGDELGSALGGRSNGNAGG